MRGSSADQKRQLEQLLANRSIGRVPHVDDASIAQRLAPWCIALALDRPRPVGAPRRLEFASAKTLETYGRMRRNTVIEQRHAICDWPHSMRNKPRPGKRYPAHLVVLSAAILLLAYGGTWLLFDCHIPSGLEAVVAIADVEECVEAVIKDGTWCGRGGNELPALQFPHGNKVAQR